MICVLRLVTNMEYILGSIVTLLCLFILNVKINKVLSRKIPIPQYTQSRKFSMLKQFVIEKNKNKQENNKYFNRDSKRGIVVDEIAYWIENGFLVCADIKYGKIDHDSQKRVDIYNLDSVELDKIQFIVDKLREGNDDSSNTGH